MEAMEDELERLRSENARLMEANRVLAAENEALKHNPVDALWPIRQHLLAQLHHHHQQQQQQRHPEENALEKAVPPKDKEEMSKETSALSPRSSMREKILDEIIETETRYVSDMTLLHNLFRNPLLASVNDNEEVLTKQEFETVFANEETLLQLNSQFLRDLRESKRDEIGIVFESYAPMFRLYSNFCAGLARAFDVVKVLRERPASAAILKLVEKLPDLRKLPLESFLSLPMQRVLRYVLFLETLDKHTDESHPDKKHVQAALAKLRVIAAVVNDSVNVQDKAKRLLELHIAECPFELVQPFRKLVREGPISKITSIAVVEDHYVLLSDVLVYTTKWPQYLAYKGHVPLGPCWVRDLPDSKHLKNMIQLVAPSKTFTFFFPEVEQKMGWLKDLSDCIAALVQHDPTLVEQRGKVKPRHPSSNFYAVLRSVFGYSPEMIEEEKEEPQDLDEFVLIGSSDATPHGVIRVSEFADEEKQFGEFAFWRAEI